MSEVVDTTVVDFSAHYTEEGHTGGTAQVQSDTATTVTEDTSVDDVSNDPELYLEWLQMGGVDKVVLSHPLYMAHDVLEETEGRNDEIGELLQSYEDYYGLASIPVGIGREAAAAEFERCMDKGFNAAGVTVTADGNHFTDEIYEPVWEVADRTGAPIMVHPTPSRKLDPGEHVLEPVKENNHTFGRESRLCGSINRVVQSELLESYPDLNLVYHHFGGNIASMMGRIDLRLHRTAETISFDQFKERLEDRIYLDTSGYHSYSTPLRNALEQFPTSNILLGTDSPVEAKTMGELQEYLTTIEEAVPRSEAKQMLGENALDLLVNT